MLKPATRNKLRRSRFGRLEISWMRSINLWIRKYTLTTQSVTELVKFLTVNTGFGGEVSEDETFEESNRELSG
jgi:hypothetical protein